MHAEHDVDTLIAIGGENTLGVAKRLTDDGIGVVGVPKTIDNDLRATDYTFGFDTAVHIAGTSNGGPTRPEAPGGVATLELQSSNVIMLSSSPI